MFSNLFLHFYLKTCEESGLISGAPGRLSQVKVPTLSFGSGCALRFGRLGPPVGLHAGHWSLLEIQDSLSPSPYLLFFPLSL